MAVGLLQGELAYPSRRDGRCPHARERACAPGTVRRDPRLHGQPAHAISALRLGRPAGETPRQRRGAKVRRAALHVQPGSRRSLLPLSLPAAPVIPGGCAELRGDGNPGARHRHHREFAGTRDDQDHRRLAR